MKAEHDNDGNRPLERVFSAHTPGPWEIGPRPTQIMTSVEAAMKYAPNKPYVYLMLASTCCDPHPDRSVANARLIAAAPDLLAACEAMIAADFGAAEWTPGMDVLARDMRAAVAKAVGANA